MKTQATKTQATDGSAVSAIGWRDAYMSALQNFLNGGGENALLSAYEVGRGALMENAGVLEMAEAYHAALAGAIAQARDVSEARRIVLQAAQFFSESIAPYEMAHRAFQEASSTWRRLNETLEEEFKRVAYAVHDGAGQLLDVARFTLSDVARDMDEKSQARLQEIFAALNQVESELRRFSHELRPLVLDDLGLVPALRFLAEGVSKRSNLTVHIESSLKMRPPAPIETALYRISQEALTNAAKHSGARNVWIQLCRQAKNLYCSIRDDGAGFDTADVLAKKEGRGLGLVGIQERLNSVGGTLRLVSSPGRGTEFQISIPMEK